MNPHRPFKLPSVILVDMKWEKSLLMKNIGRLGILQSVFFLMCILQADPGFIWCWQRTSTTGFPYNEKHNFFFSSWKYECSSDLFFFHESGRERNNHRKFPLRSHSKQLERLILQNTASLSASSCTTIWNEIEGPFASLPQPGNSLLAAEYLSIHPFYLFPFAVLCTQVPRPHVRTLLPQGSCGALSGGLQHLQQK